VETLATLRKLTIPPRGRLSQHGVVGLLGLLGLVRATGVLDVSWRRLRRRLVLSGGEVVALVSNALDDRLLEWAAGSGRLDVEEARLDELKVRLGEAPLSGRALVDEGLVDEADVSSLLADHARWHIREMSGWKEGEFEISPGSVSVNGEPTASVPALELAVVLGRESPPPGAPRSIAPLTVVAVAESDGEIEALLTGEEREVLDACRKPLRRDELAATLPDMAADDLNRVVTSLWRAGLLAGAVRPALGDATIAGYETEVTRDEIEAFLAAAEAADFENLLRVPVGADPAEVRRAYYRTVRRLHPDRFLHGRYSEFHGEIESAFRTVHEALEVLSDPAHRRAAIRSTARRSDPELLARGYLAQARKAATEGHRADALMLLESALQQVPGHVDLQLSRGLLLAGNPMRRDDACALLNQLAVNHPDRADILAASSLALAAAQRDDESETMRRRAWVLDPDDPTVRALEGDKKALKNARKNPFIAPLLGRRAAG